MSGWRKRTIVELAREVKMPYDFVTGEPINIEKLEAFAALVRADERDKWMERTAILIRGEREACAKVCEDYGRAEEMQAIGNDYANAIRARGQA
jgi:hypothetical protein